MRLSMIAIVIIGLIACETSKSNEVDLSEIDYNVLGYKAFMENHNKLIYQTIDGIVDLSKEA